MTQPTYYQLPNEAGLAFRQHLNENLLGQETDFAGAVAPTSTQPFMRWLDTSVSPPALRRRSSDNLSWDKYYITGNELAGDTGAGSIGNNRGVAGSVHTTAAQLLNSRAVSITEFGGVDDYNGDPYTPNTNNITAFASAITYLNSIGGGDLLLPKTMTGGYLVNGDDPTQVTTPIRLVADSGVSITLIYSGGLTASPLSNNNIKSNIEIDKHLFNFGFTAPIGPLVGKRLSETMPTVNNSDGVIAIPSALQGDAFSVYRLSDTKTPIPPVSTASDSVVYAGGGAETLVTIPAKVGLEISSLIISGYPEKFIAGVITTNGHGYFQHDAATGLIEYHESTTGYSTIAIGVPYTFLNQQRDYFNNSVLTVKVISNRVFAVLANGLAVGTIRTRSNIVAAGFGTTDSTHNVSLSQMFSVAGNSKAGAKPLRIIVCGDSISDNNVQYSHAKYLTNILGTAGVQIAEVNNLAVSGETAANQYARLKGVGYGYDYCLIQVGVNDIQGSTDFSAFQATIVAMITHCLSNGIQPIVAIPTGFYSKAEANAHGQTGGQNTANNTSAHTYRALLVRAVASAGGLLNTETIKAYGPITANWLDITPYGANDKMQVDNIHPTPYASMMLAHGWARCILGHINMCDMSAFDSFESIPASWLSSGFGLLSTPAIRGKEFRGTLSLHATLSSDGAIAMTLPAYMISGSNEMRPVVCLSAGGLPTGTCTMYIGANGNVYFFGLPAGTTSVSLDKISM